MKRTKHLYRLFTWPAMITMLVIMIAPMLFAVYISLNHVNLLENAGRFSFAGLQNFLFFFTDARGLNSVWVTVKFVLGALAAELVLGLAVSMLLDRPFRFKGAVRSLVIIPMFMTPVVSGLVWRTFFDPSAGIISYVFKLLTGSPLDLLGNRLLALPAVILVDVWQWTPFFILLCMASLDNLPDDVLEAARVEGANEWQIFFHVILPLVKPALGTVVTFGFIMIWDQYLLPLIVVNQDSLNTIPVILGTLRTDESITPNIFIAITLLAMLPSIIVYLGLQKHFNRGIMSGAVKG